MLKKIKYYLASLSYITFVDNWYLIPLAYFGLVDLKEGKILKLKNGLRFKILHYFDALALKEMFCDNDYHFKATGKPMTVIDIGANIGDSCVFFASRSPKVKVIAFEPSQDTYEQFKYNIMLNKLEKQITSIHKAVYSKTTKIKLFNPGPSGQRSLYNKRTYKNFETVATTTLVDILKTYKIKKCDFLKLDCEGAEYDILLSASKNTLQKIKQMAMECHNIDDRTNIEKLIEYLKVNQFKVREIKHSIETDLCYLYATRQ